MLNSLIWRQMAEDVDSSVTEPPVVPCHVALQTRWQTDGEDGTGQRQAVVMFVGREVARRDSAGAGIRMHWLPVLKISWHEPEG